MMQKIKGANDRASARKEPIEYKPEMRSVSVTPTLSYNYNAL